MFSEIALMCGFGALGFKLKQEPDMSKVIKKKWKKIIAAYPNAFTNNLGKVPEILEIEQKEYGWNMKVELPLTYTVEDLERHIPIFEEGLGFHEIQIRPYGNIVWLTCIKEKEFKEYRHIQLPPNVLLICDGLDGPVIVDMNVYPHIICGGDPGSGKSRLLLSILTNLIESTNYKEVAIYLLQTTKNDLAVFKNCGQVRHLSRTLDDVLFSLKEIDEERQNRDLLIDPTQGIYSIKDYNKRHPGNELPYLYLVIEEFSFLNTDKADPKAVKEMKQECLGLIRQIAAAGRSAGCFLIVSLQRPTNDSIPSFIKTLITTRVSMKIKDNAPAQVITGNNAPTKLRPREVCVRSYDDLIGYSYTIDHDILMEHIREKIVNKKYVGPKPEAVKKKKSALGKIGELMDEAD